MNMAGIAGSTIRISEKDTQLVEVLKAEISTCF